MHFDKQVLLGHMKCPVIPKKVTIGKRLAQCLHPALPSGVHLKALETYDIIFKCIGPLRLVQDFFIYSAGLFPVMAHAAMSVKVILTVFLNDYLYMYVACTYARYVYAVILVKISVAAVSAGAVVNF